MTRLPRPAAAPSLAFFLSMTGLLLSLSGCGTKEMESYPPSRPTPPLTVPDGRRIPPTQRPYTIDGKTYYPIPSAYGYAEKGVASWYGPQFHGRKTSNGETYDMMGMTAAHKILPMHTRVLVRNVDNGKEVVLRINDRGPFVKDRVIDLSLAGARALGVDGPGTANVVVTAMGEAELVAGGGEARFVAYRNFNEGEFFVQIGAFANPENAQRLQAEMQRQGNKVVSEIYEQGNGSRFHRVQVWAGRNLDQARELERSWTSRYPDAFVVAR